MAITMWRCSMMVLLETMLTMNRRVGWNMEEVARLVAAYRFPPSYSCLLLILSHLSGAD